MDKTMAKVELELDIATGVVVSRAKVRATEADVKETLKIILKGINTINHLERDEVRVFDVSMDEIMVPSYIKTLLIPKSVALVTDDRRFEDMVDRQAYPSYSDVTYYDFVNAVERLAGWFKAVPDRVTLSSLRESVALTTVLDRVMENGCVSYNGDSSKCGQVIILKSKLAVAKWYFGTDYEHFIYDMWCKIVNGLSKA
jgi:hypothetical protein